MIFSENKFPLIRFATGAAPDAPPAGQIIVYTKADGNLYRKGADGVEHALGEGGAGLPPVWGGVLGDLSDQTDLVAALAGKADTGHNHDGVYVKPSDLPVFGSAATAEATDFATAAQGAKADSAVQPGALGTLAAANDVPTDGKDYVRKDGAWVEAVAPGSSGPAVTHTVAPTDGVDTDNPYLYYNQDTGVAKMYLRTPGGVYIEMGSAQVDPGTPPEEIDPDAMLLGMNFEWIRSWTDTAKVFSNLMYNVYVIDRTSGSGTWQSDLGVITSTDPDAVFRLKLLDGGLGVNVPEGEYTVLNPSGNTIYVGGPGPVGAGDSVWRTDTSFTVSLSGGGAKCLHAKGGLSNANGNTCVIMPGHLESWNAGNVWYDKCLAFYSALKLKTLRFMDAINASGSLETDWSDRALPTAQVLQNAWGPVGFYPCMPHEFICDLANRLGVDPWICVPPMATQDYVDQMAATYKAHLHSDRKVWLEGTGNEVWNSNAPFARGTNWITYLDFTKLDAVADPVTQNFTRAGHGLSDGDVIRLFEHIDSKLAVDGATAYLKYGNRGFVKIIDADTFEFYKAYSGGVFSDKPVIPDGFVKVRYLLESEAGKTPDQNGNYARVAKRNWDAFDAALSRSKVVHVLARHFSNTSTISEALAVAGVKAATDFVATAPYFYGRWCGAKLSAADGTITPQWWCNMLTTVQVGVYAHGATPTMQEVIDGTDAVATQTITYGADSTAWSPGTAVSGLTNGTEYDVHFVFSDNGADFRLVGSITPSASAVDPVIVTDSFANQALRNNLGSSGSERLSRWVSAKIAADGVPLVNYECGLHYHESSPTEIAAWLAEYQQSPEFAAAISADMLFNQTIGVRDYNYYAGVLGTTFSIADSYDDVLDNRYLAYKAQGGIINPVTSIDIAASIKASDVETAPSSLPATVYTFADATASYSIIGGNRAGRFAMSGNALRYVDDAGVDYDDPELQSLNIAVSKDGQVVFTTVTFQLGYSWYESDAIFAFDSFKDIEATAMNPQVGSAVPITGNGSGYASISGGMWSLPAERGYKEVAAMTVAPSASNDIFFAAVLQFGSSIVSSSVLVKFGNNPGLQIYATGSNKVRGELSSTDVGNVQLLSTNSCVSTKAVYWGVLRGGQNLTYGINQDIQATGAATGALTGAIGKDVAFGDARTSREALTFGSSEVVARASITDVEAKAMVAKMQALHGIS